MACSFEFLSDESFKHNIIALYHLFLTFFLSYNLRLLWYSIFKYRLLVSLLIHSAWIAFVVRFYLN